MIKFKNQLNKKLLWESNQKSLSYELTFDGKKMAKLKWGSNFGTLASGKTAYGEWTLKRVGFFRPFITVRQKNGKKNLAIVRFNFTNQSVIKFRSGEQFFWKNLNAWRGEWGFVDSEGNLILRVIPNFNKKGADGFLYVESVDHINEILSVLILAGWFTLVSFTLDEQFDEEMEQIGH